MATNRLADNLQELMRARNINPTALSRSTGIGQPVIYRMTTGETDNPTLSTLQPIAQYFGVTMNQLVGDEPLDQHHLRQQLKMIPLIHITQASEWTQKPKNITPARYLMVDHSLSDKGFALQLEDSTMEPNFPEGTTLIVDPSHKPSNRDFVVAYHRDDKNRVTFKQLLVDGKEKYLKPLNPEFETIKATETHVIIGPMIQARLDFK